MDDVDAAAEVIFDGVVVVFYGVAVEDGGEFGADYLAYAGLAFGAFLVGGVAGGGSSVGVFVVLGG